MCHMHPKQRISCFYVNTALLYLCHLGTKLFWEVENHIKNNSVTGSEAAVPLNRRLFLNQQMSVTFNVTTF